MKKIVFIVIDGLGDDKIPQLKNKTPLEAAHTSNLDFLAQQGICGTMIPFLLPNQKMPDSAVSHLALFGYNPKKYYLGRGPYEALGIGAKLHTSDLVLRVNFSSLDKVIKDRRASRIKNKKPLIKAISGIKIKGIKFDIYDSLDHRAVLVLRGKNLSCKISDGDSKKTDQKPKKIIGLSKSAEFTAQVLNEYLEKTYDILDNHEFNKQRRKQGLLPANYLLVRGPGKFRKTPRFKIKSACVAGGFLYSGIALSLGMDLIKVSGANAGFNTNLVGKVRAVLNNLAKYDFIFLHIKATDTLAEDGKYIEKKDFLEKIDKALKPFLSKKNIVLVIGSDHSTSCLKKSHVLNPIPFLIWNNKDKKDFKGFSEKECRAGKSIKQINFLKYVFSLIK